MKKYLALLMAAFCVSAASAQQIIATGDGNKNINIIDIKTNKVVWKYALDNAKKERSNSVTMLKGGKLIAFSTQVGVKVVNLKKEVVLEYKHDRVGKAEIHSVYALKDGGFAAFEAGVPAKIVVFSKKMKKVKEIEFDGISPNKHGQFRQAIQASNGNWMVPSFPRGSIREIDNNGKQVTEYKVGGGAFGIGQAHNGELLLGLGDSHKFVKYDMANQKVTSTIINTSLKGKDINLLFCAQFQEVEHGKFMVANWTGHRRGAPVTLPEPQVMMIDENNKIIWAWDDKGHNIGMVSAFYYSKKDLVK